MAFEIQLAEPATQDGATNIAEDVKAAGRRRKEVGVMRFLVKCPK